MTIHDTIDVSHNSVYGSGVLDCRPKAWMYEERSLQNRVDATACALPLLNKLIKMNMILSSYLRQRMPNRSRLLLMSTTRLLKKKRKFLTRGSVSRSGSQGYGETQKYTSMIVRRTIGRIVLGKEKSARCTHDVGDFTAFPVVVLEFYECYFDSMYVIIFDLAQRMHTSLVPFAATESSRLDCAEG